VWYKKMGNPVDITGTWNASGSAFGVSLAFVVVRGLDPNSPYAITDDVKAELAMIAPNNTVVRARDIQLCAYHQTGTPSAIAFTAYNPPAGLIIQPNVGSASSGRFTEGIYILEGLSPGTVAGISVTTNHLVDRLGSNLILHATPPINRIQVSFDIDLGAEAIMDTFPGAEFIEPEELVIEVTMGARMKSYRPPFVPRRPLVWVKNLRGEQVDVLD
jgi:hypothetical protein